MMVDNFSRFLSGKIDKLSVDYMIAFAQIFQESTDFPPSKKWGSSEME